MGCSPTPLQNSPITHLSHFHALHRRITIVWAKTALHLESPSSLYLQICAHPRNFRANPSLPLPPRTGHVRSAPDASAPPPPTKCAPPRGLLRRPRAAGPLGPLPAPEARAPQPRPPERRHGSAARRRLWSAPPGPAPLRPLPTSSSGELRPRLGSRVRSDLRTRG